MQTITLGHTLPLVFARQTDIKSDIWRQEVSLERGKFYLIEAASGTGKSSLCSYLQGYRRDYEGEIRFDGRDTRSLSVGEWARIRQKSIITVHQELRLFPELSTWDNIQIKNNLSGGFRKDSEIRDWLEALGIADKAEEKTGRMSFGQQQRVALIRALVQPFDFLLADEPVSHLDDTNARLVGDILSTEAKRQGAAVIVTSIGKHMNLPYAKTFHL
ncbi:MAG: ATP-binding cassette domain-containing protein [Alloprevotella sp.]|nr:ATP-binding cassette domain-containing protein [Alloprevotella sp.]